MWFHEFKPLEISELTIISRSCHDCQCEFIVIGDVVGKSQLEGIAMLPLHGKKQQSNYEGWKEPKIAISFNNHSHIYYGIVWSFIVTFLVLSNN